MRTLALVVAIVGLAVSLPVTPGIGAAPAAIQLGAVIPLSGRYGGGGAQIRAGYQFAVADINRAGGVSVGGQKMPLALTILDDGSDATKTVSQFETLGSQGSIVFLGGFGSDLHAAAAAVAEKDKIPYCGVAFALHSVHEQGFKYLFSPFPKSPQLAVETYRALNASIPAAQRPTRVAIFEERTDWGREMADNWTARSQEYGYQVVLRAQYSSAGPGSLRHHPARQERRRERGVRPPDAARRHHDDPADEAAGLQPADRRHSARRGRGHLVAGPRQGRGRRPPHAGLASLRDSSRAWRR